MADPPVDVQKGASLPAQPPPARHASEDSDPDFDDLDDVLDQFSANAPPKETPEPAPSSSGPGRPAEDAVAPTISPPAPDGQRPNESEDDFMKRLTSEMQTMMTQLSQDPAASSANPEDLAKMGKELDDFTRKLEAEGIEPQDLLKAILGEDVGAQVARDAEKEHERRESQSQSRSPAKPSKPSSKAKSTLPPPPQPSSSSSTKAAFPNPPSKPATGFEESLRQTMNRLETSDKAASASTSQAPQSDNDLLASLLQTLDTSSTSENPDDLSRMFLSMMEQLTHREMLYDPMKELDAKFPAWLSANTPKLPAKDVIRFKNQQGIVREIVAKFEEKGYSDDDPGCREYIWERMQRMQAEGSPPEDLISSPFPGMGMGGMPDLGALGAGAEGGEAGCPTQ